MKKYILMTIVLLAGAGLLVACGGDSEKSTTINTTEKINNIVVPPDPGEAGKETLAGIDSNSSGIRDDVERFIAEEHGDNVVLHNAISVHAKNIQRLLNTNELKKQGDVLASQNSEIQAYIKSIECENDSSNLVDSKSAVTNLYLNTEQRQEKYNSYFSGMLFSVEGDDCENQ